MFHLANNSIDLTRSTLLIVMNRYRSIHLLKMRPTIVVDAEFAFASAAVADVVVVDAKYLMIMAVVVAVGDNEH